LTRSSIGVAVIGAGMAGRAHASGYRSAPAVFDTDLPDVRLVAVADAHEPFAIDTARRFGYERAETSWQAVAEAADIDAVSVVVANGLHREIVEALLDAGKHVLCEKPLAASVADGQAMVDRAEMTDRVAAVGFTFRRSPAISAAGPSVPHAGPAHGFPERGSRPERLFHLPGPGLPGGGLGPGPPAPVPEPGRRAAQPASARRGSRVRLRGRPGGPGRVTGQPPLPEMRQP
jgi:hypothetical protein